jgi:hypothetical protein
MALDQRHRNPDLHPFEIGLPRFQGADRGFHAGAVAIVTRATFEFYSRTHPSWRESARPVGRRSCPSLSGACPLLRDGHIYRQRIQVLLPTCPARPPGTSIAVSKMDDSMARLPEDSESAVERKVRCSTSLVRVGTGAPDSATRPQRDQGLAANETARQTNPSPLYRFYVKAPQSIVVPPLAQRGEHTVVVLRAWGSSKRSPEAVW